MGAFVYIKIPKRLNVWGFALILGVEKRAATMVLSGFFYGCCNRFSERIGLLAYLFTVSKFTNLSDHDDRFVCGYGFKSEDSQIATTSHSYKNDKAVANFYLKKSMITAETSFSEFCLNNNGFFSLSFPVADQESPS
ncbi:MAG: hypothetical protein PHP35_00675 [Candidatus Colwellbacteria bacterium]|nr:hypothetical protein [Candidatus Colwellbacteria bacterium]